jgi:phosphatidylserine decarboxylase
MRSVINRLTQQEDLNFLLTNRIPRRLATRFMGWFTHIEQSLVRDLSIAIWRFFGEVDLSDVEKKQFASVHDCFTRAQPRANTETIPATGTASINKHST